MGLTGFVGKAETAVQTPLSRGRSPVEMVENLKKLGVQSWRKFEDRFRSHSSNAPAPLSMVSLAADRPQSEECSWHGRD